jgi:hypothetical protein
MRNLYGFDSFRLCDTSKVRIKALPHHETLQAQAEQVLADPAASINDKVRIDGAARRARMPPAVHTRAAYPPRVLGSLRRLGRNGSQ